MAQIPFAVWNVEWLNELFTGDPPVIKADDERGYMTRQRIKDRRRDLAGVINELDVAVWVFVEGPNQTAELDLFFNLPEINGTWQCAVQPAGAQSVGVAVRTDTGLFDTNALTWFDIKTNAIADSLRLATNEFKMDTDGDGLDEIHKFERRPLYAQVQLAGGKSFRIVGLHLKSKGIFKALEWSKWWATADGNRKKIIAQCHQIRTHFLNNYLTEDSTKDIPLIVCGDINDGPGFDTSEMKLKASGVERLMGSIWHPELCLGNALFDTLSEKDKKELDFSDLYTASFADPIFNHTYRKAWIDHILYSSPEKKWITAAQVRIKMNDGTPIYKKYPKSSDHMPITCVIDTDKM